MANIQQAQRVHAILTDVYGQSPWTLEQILADMTQDETDYFYVYDEGELVGFLAIQLLVGEVEITNLAVKTSHQGKGLADQLMTHLVSLDVPIFLEVRESNLPAQHLYSKHGFTAVGLRKNYYHDPIEHAVLMTRA